tara:strand:- start:80 stop:985 length:906 start_codon:yes stop_codon:yes gene_type:complete
MTKILLFIFIAILSLSYVHAYTIENFNTEIEVYDDGVAKVTQNIILDTRGIKDVFSVPAHSPESVIIIDENGEVKFATLDQEIIIKPQIRSKTYEVRIQYLTNSLTSKDEDKWIVNHLIPAYGEIGIDDIKEARLTLILPGTTTLSSFSDNGVIYTENSDLRIAWKLHLKKDKETKIEAIYANNIEESTDWIKIGFYALLTILVIVLLVFCINKGYCKITKRIGKGKKDIINTLENREKEVVKLLLENKNQLYQSKIQKDTGISKATLSRVIKRLENRNIIEVRPSGNTNLILLQEWFVKK